MQEDVADLGKELERARDEAGMDGAALTSAKAKAHTFASDIDGVRERSEGAEANQKDAVNRAKSAEGSKRSEAESLNDILG